MSKLSEVSLGISYPEELEDPEVFEWWRQNAWSEGFHLFDEVQSVTRHYLSCDACDLSVDIVTPVE